MSNILPSKTTEIPLLLKPKVLHGVIRASPGTVSERNDAV